MNFKTCNECNLDFPVESFKEVTVRGRKYRLPRCPACQRTYQRDYYHANKERILSIREAREDGDLVAVYCLSREAEKKAERIKQGIPTPVTPPPGSLRACSRCRKLDRPHLHPLEAFSPNMSAPDGYSNWCKRCVNENQKERRAGYTNYLVWNEALPLTDVPVRGAFKAQYPAEGGKILVGWFVRLDKDRLLKDFRLEYPTTRVRQARTNPIFKELIVRCTPPENTHYEPGTPPEAPPDGR